MSCPTSLWGSMARPLSIAVLGAFLGRTRSGLAETQYQLPRASSCSSCLGAQPERGTHTLATWNLEFKNASAYSYPPLTRDAEHEVEVVRLREAGPNQAHGVGQTSGVQPLADVVRPGQAEEAMEHGDVVQMDWASDGQLLGAKGIDKTCGKQSGVRGAGREKGESFGQAFKPRSSPTWAVGGQPQLVDSHRRGLVEHKANGAVDVVVGRDEDHRPVKRRRHFPPSGAGQEQAAGLRMAQHVRPGGGPGAEEGLATAALLLLLPLGSQRRGIHWRSALVRRPLAPLSLPPGGLLLRQPAQSHRDVIM